MPVPALARLQSLLSPTARFRVGRLLLHRTLVARAYLRVRPAFERYRYVAGCDLVIDGFPRSANTYAWYAVRGALGSDAVVRGHTHSPETLLAAVRHDTPALLVVREPDAAVASYVQLQPGVDLAAAFDAYVHFHRPLLTRLDQIVVADFRDVVSDLRDVMQRVNERYGTDFPLYEATPEAEAAVGRQIEDSVRARWGGELREAGVARPSASRRAPEEVLAEADAAAEAARRRAQRIYAAVSLE